MSCRRSFLCIMWLADPMKSDEHVMLCGYNNHDSPGTMGHCLLIFGIRRCASHRQHWLVRSLRQILVALSRKLSILHMRDLVQTHIHSRIDWLVCSVSAGRGSVSHMDCKDLKNIHRIFIDFHLKSCRKESRCQ